MTSRLLALAGVVATAAMIGVHARVTPASIALAWGCLVPWLAVLERARTLRTALGAGLLMSVGFVAAVFPWFPAMIADYTGAPWVVAAAVVVLLAPVVEPQFVAFAVARWAARRLDGRWWPAALAAAGVYVGAEWCWPKLFLDTLGHPLHASPRLRQAADLVGAHGLTFAMLVGNECLLTALVSGCPAEPTFGRSSVASTRSSPTSTRPATSDASTTAFSGPRRRRGRRARRRTRAAGRWRGTSSRRRRTRSRRSSTSSTRGARRS